MTCRTWRRPVRKAGVLYRWRFCRDRQSSSGNWQRFQPWTSPDPLLARRRITETDSLEPEIKYNSTLWRGWVTLAFLYIYAIYRQEAQLLLGDRATRKHAKGCWNARGNDNLGGNDLQMYSKVIKSGTNRKLVYDFLPVVYSNFCRITYRSWEIWCETV